jgi:hypothetical protein
MSSKPNLLTTRSEGLTDFVFDVVSLTHKGACGNIFITQSIAAPLGNARKLLAVCEIIDGRTRSVLLYVLDEQDREAVMKDLELLRQKAREQVEKLRDGQGVTDGNPGLQE